MERLVSPWRSKYISTFSSGAEAQGECVLCAAHRKGGAEDQMLVSRGKTAYVVMNHYPYNSGHLMIVPYRHVNDIALLTAEETAEVMKLTKLMMAALREVVHPDGFNFGANVGRPAGAGIEQHIHFHLVPRWNGDTNFMPVLADTKLVSDDMANTLRKLRDVVGRKEKRRRS